MRGWIVSTIALIAALRCGAIDLSLDSIAEWGRFPRFAVNTYRWGCDFFNGYDTTYVSGTGYPFNVKIRTDSWTDSYGLRFDNDTRMGMVTRPSTSVGVYLTYLAVSAGYDMNVSKWLGGDDRIRRRWNFQFNCMLFTAQLYFMSNDVGTRITSLRPADGPTLHPRRDFDHIDNTEWGVELCYYFTHKRYSAAAAFNFSRVQRRSAGSFFAGLSYNRQNYSFDFSGLPPDITGWLPTGAEGYTVDNRNYLLKVGYGYNWVVRDRWVIGMMEAPMVGVSCGRASLTGPRRSTFALRSATQLSAVYNNGRWFAGAIGTMQAGLIRNSMRTLLNAYFTLELSAGYRFALW